MTELNYPDVLPQKDHSGRLTMLNALMGVYEHKGLDIYNTHDYYECRELLDIASGARQAPEDKLQELENDKFNKYLDKVSYNKFKWTHIDKKHNLWVIKDMSPTLLTPTSNDSVSS